MTDNEKYMRDILFDTMQKNPDLPIVAMVGSEFIAYDDYSRYFPLCGYSRIEECFLEGDRIYFRDDDDDLYEVDRVLNKILDTELYDDIETDAEARNLYASLPWIKAIVINIDVPESE